MTTFRNFQSITPAHAIIQNGARWPTENAAKKTATRDSILLRRFFHRQIEPVTAREVMNVEEARHFVHPSVLRVSRRDQPARALQGAAQCPNRLGMRTTVGWPVNSIQHPVAATQRFNL